ncbi:hypothetical protein C8Q74DRAFT_1218925 [Fomes fomentarius]|nr:hypothetical protein C8Q74DRAFT_1218925 [Fomes fomentarius]
MCKVVQTDKLRNARDLGVADVEACCDGAAGNRGFVRAKSEARPGVGGCPLSGTCVECQSDIQPFPNYTVYDLQSCLDCGQNNGLNTATSESHAVLFLALSSQHTSGWDEDVSFVRRHMRPKGLTPDYKRRRRDSEETGLVLSRDGVDAEVVGLDDERLLQLELVLVHLVVLDEIELESLEDENESERWHSPV